MSHEHAHSLEAHAPQPSYLPLLLAIALTVMVAGLMINVVVVAAGAILTVAGIIAWGVERFHGPEQAAYREPRTLELPQVTGERELVVTPPVEGERATPWWGMIWFIASEATFFAFLIASYIYLRATSEVWPPPGTPHQELGFPIINTIILLASGIPAYYAQRAIRKGDRRGLLVGLIGAAVLGIIFLGGQAYEYSILGLTPQSNIFAAGFYTLTGFHGLHVSAGIGLLIVMAVLSSRGWFSAERHFGVEFAGTYWHFVDVVWIFLFTLLYVVR